MFSFLSNFAVLYLALVTALMAWIFGGMRAPSLLPVVPWLFFFLVEVLLAFPQRFAGEALSDARARVWLKLKRDPLTWVTIGLLALLSIPFVNNGLCPLCDRELIAQGISPKPPVPILPFCVNRGEQLTVLMWFAIALPTALAVKHCLRRSGQRLLIEILVWNGFVLGILGFIQAATGAEAPLWIPFDTRARGGTFFSTFGYPNMAGDYFTTLFGLSVAVWRRRNDEIDDDLRLGSSSECRKISRHRLFWKRHILLVPMTIAFLSAVNTLSRAAIILVSLLAVVYFIHTFISFTHQLSKARRVRNGTIACAITGFVIFFAIRSLPEDVQHEVDTLNTEAVLTRVTGKGQYHVRVATEIWKDHILFGCGGWGYKHFCIPKMTPEELKDIQMVGGINVHNDYLQFLAEHGIVGFGLISFAAFLLIVPIIKRWSGLVKKTRFMKKGLLPARPVQLFVLPAPVFCILTTSIATIIHGFGDCPLRSSAVLTLFYVSLAAAPGFLPKDDWENDEDPALASSVHRHHHHHRHNKR